MTFQTVALQTVTLIDAAVMAGVCGILGSCSVICLLALRKHRAAVEQTHAQLQSMLHEHKVEFSGQIERLGREMEVLELRPQNIDVAGKTGLTRSVRAQAMQLLRCGMSPDNAASALGIGRREMRLIAMVLRTLSLQ